MWKEILIDKKPFFIRTNYKNKKWKVVLVNLEEIWVQHLSHEEAIEKCQHLNPLLDVDNLNLDEIINEILNNVMNHAVYISVNEIRIKKEIDGGVFKFTINLTKGKLQDIWEEIIKPIYNNAYELQCQNRIMAKELKKKDEEITEYKLNGTLLRKEIETKRFDDNLFKNTEMNFDTSSFFLMFNSLMNQNDGLIMESLSNDSEKQTNKIERMEKNKDRSNNDIEAISIDGNCEVEDNNQNREVLMKPETEIIKMTGEASKNTCEKVNLGPIKIKKPDRQQKVSMNKKRPRKELSNFIS